MVEKDGVEEMRAIEKAKGSVERIEMDNDMRKRRKEETGEVAVSV
jgi:hypothetical protein